MERPLPNPPPLRGRGSLDDSKFMNIADEVDLAHQDGKHMVDF
jgi:hypothetical protein